MNLVTTLRRPARRGVSGWSPLALAGDLVLWQRADFLGNPNLLVQSNKFDDAAWALFNTPVITDNLDGTWDVEDDSAGLFESFSQNLTNIGATETFTFQVKFKKTVSATSFPGVRLLITGLAGAVTVNTDDGTLTDRDTEPPTASSISDNGDGYWTASVTLTNSFAGSTINAAISPAIDPDGSGTWSATTTGTVTIKQSQLEVGAAASSYRANGATAAGLVNAWPSSVAGLPSADQAVQANMPLLDANVVGGLPGVKFDGVNDYSTLTSSVSAAGVFTFFAALEPDLTAAVGLCGAGNPKTDSIEVSTAGVVSIKIASAVAVNLTAAGAVTTEVSQTLVIVRDASSDLFCYVDGVDVTLGSPNQAGTFLVTELGAASAVPDQPLTDYMFEPGIAVRDLDDSGDRPLLQAYLERWVIPGLLLDPASGEPLTDPLTGEELTT